MGENTSAYNAPHEAKTKFYRYQQLDEDTLLAAHMHNFNDLCSNIEYHSVNIFIFDKDMVKK